MESRNLRVVDLKLIRVAQHPMGVTRQWLCIAGLTKCFLCTQASSTEERKRDFEKIFAHYDVVSVLYALTPSLGRKLTLFLCDKV